MRVALAITGLILLATMLYANVEGGTRPSIEPPRRFQGLEAFLGLNARSEAKEAQQKREAKVQSMIRRCMARHGFRYIPFDGGRLPKRLSLSPGAYARRLGFGIVSEALGMRPNVGKAVVPDPNADVVARLAPHERERYWRMLLGPTGVEGKRTPEESPHLSAARDRGGCDYTARDQVYGRIRSIWRSLQPAIDRMNRRIEEEPATQAATREWQECMSKGGYAFPNHDAMWAWIRKAFYRRSQRTDRPQSHEELTALFLQEKRLAEWVWRCDRALQKAMTAIRLPYEHHLLSERRQLFRRLREAMMVDR